MKGRITQITQLTHDVKSFHIALPEKVDYKPGQFCVVELEAQGKMRKRAYSLVSAPHWENIEIIVKIHPEGKVTPVLFGLHEGDELEVKLPYGVFKLDDSILPQKMVFLAGGVGLSAVLSMMRHLEHINYRGEKVLLYGNRTPDDIIYHDELERMKHDWGLNIVYTIDHPQGTGWHGETGYITEEMIRNNCDIKNSYFYMCGPPQFVGHMVQNLEHLGIAHERINRELW